MRIFFEFFAGGGMARAGYGAGWRCAFANDWDAMKGRTYAQNWGEDHLIVGDVRQVASAQLPGLADSVWASFPCQDISLAGNYEGLGHRARKNPTRSGAFWPFWSKMSDLILDGRAPRTIVLENVIGLLTSNGGQDFATLGSTLSNAGYRFGAVVGDARLFLPQSRPRIFIVAVRSDHRVPALLSAPAALMPWHTDALRSAHSGLSATAKRRWVWWNLPLPERPALRLEDVIEQEPTGVDWHTQAETAYLLSLMSERNLAKVRRAQQLDRVVVGTVYRRTRADADGVKRQRAEARFDGTAGCLRTPSGGSSRQTLLIVNGNVIRSRLLSPREAARLMGLPDSFKLPPRYNDAYHVAGDGVAVPVVAHIREHLLEPILAASDQLARQAA